MNYAWTFEWVDLARGGQHYEACFSGCDKELLKCDGARLGLESCHPVFTVHHRPLVIVFVHLYWIQKLAYGYRLLEWWMRAGPRTGHVVKSCFPQYKGLLYDLSQHTHPFVPRYSNGASFEKAGPFLMKGQQSFKGQCTWIVIGTNILL